MHKWLIGLQETLRTITQRRTGVPWLSGPSIYDHIVRHIDPATGKLTPAGQTLPDAEHRSSQSGLKWAPGAFDGVMAYHTRPPDPQPDAQRMAALLLRIAGQDDHDAKTELYQFTVEQEASTGINAAAITESLRICLTMRPAAVTEHLVSRLCLFALTLAKNAPDRGPVKWAMISLGSLSSKNQNLELFLTLGRHAEFTLFAANAIARLARKPEQSLWELAKQVEGWGRVHLVERLARTKTPEIKDWLLRNGCRDNPLAGYIAYECAVAGDLQSALSGDTVDDDLLAAAGEILTALLPGGPAADLNDYQPAPQVLLRYLQIINERASRVEHFLLSREIIAYVANLDDEEGSPPPGWTPEIGRQVTGLAEQVVGKPLWHDVVAGGLASDEDKLFSQSMQAADILGIDTWERCWERLNAKPLNSQRWFDVMKRTTPERIDQVIDLALRVSRFEKVMTGPALQTMQNPRQALGTYELLHIIRMLQDFPGKGWRLVAAGLQYSQLQARPAALTTLEVWGRANWPEGTRLVLEEALRDEPDPGVRTRLEELLQEAGTETRPGQAVP